MTDKQSGLRFDIYERVHLPEAAGSIAELEEVELVPHIQASVEGDQAVLRGYLLLAGTYTAGGETEPDSREVLEHTIPVEITLPQSRVHSLDNISVNIEQFDVDILSSRSLNVTGVLSLSGISVAPARTDPWQEEIVFVHEPEQEPLHGAYRVDQFPDEAPSFQAEEVIEETAERVEPVPKPQPKPQVMPEPEPVKPPEIAVPIPEFKPEPKPEPILKAEPEHKPENKPEMKSEFKPEHKAEHKPENKPEHKAHEKPEAAEEKLNMHEYNAPEIVQPVSEEAPVEKKEPKVEFGKKGAEPVKEKKFDFKSLFHRAGGATALEAPNSEETAHAEAIAAAGSRESVEWKKLFLGSQQDVQQFRKVKMCIVQKEETLETIAERYSLKAQEIQLYNRLSSQEINEGQVLYIPT